MRADNPAPAALVERTNGSDPLPCGSRPPAPWKSLDDALAGLWLELAEADAEIAELRERLDDEGGAIILGSAAAEGAARHGEPVAIYSTPTRWAVDGRRGALVLNWAAPPRDLIRALWLDQHSRVLAEDDATAGLLAAVLKAAGVEVESIKVSAAWEEPRRAAA